jgi:hypothetical protein
MAPAFFFGEILFGRFCERKEVCRTLEVWHTRTYPFKMLHKKSGQIMLWPLLKTIIEYYLLITKRNTWLRWSELACMR